MIGYYKTTFHKAGVMLHALKADINNLTVLLELQTLLIRQIKRSECNILRLKSSANELKASLRRDRLSKENAQEVKRKIKAVLTRVNEYKHLIYLWKCFGDGIAHIYLDKYALKHTFFSVADYSVKEAAGFMTGKDGFRLEWSIVRKILTEVRHPILLCDLTNVIRHGDVCMLIGPDPFLVEVKSSKNRNERVDRQLQHLKLLQKFYVEDGADEFRGVPNVRRQALANKEVNYTEALNDCISRSYAEGMSSVSPEPGVHYVCISGGLDTEKLNALASRSSMVFMLNEVKTVGLWMPYYPFTLSINPKYLYDFIKGSIYLMVLIDMKILKALFKAKGFHCTVLEGGDYALQICKNRKDLREGAFRISENLFRRIPFEFQSLAWFADEQCSAFDRAFDGISPTDGPHFEIPESWYSVKDLFDDENVNDLTTVTTHTPFDADEA